MGYLENLWNALDFGSLRDMVLRLVSVFLCLTVHETCHGLAAPVSYTHLTLPTKA